MLSRISLLTALVAGGVLCGQCGCQLAQHYEMGPQSHFTYPGGNVTPLGPTKAKRTSWVRLSLAPMPMSGELDEALYREAIGKVAGANLVIDYIKITRVYSLLILPLTWTVTELEGTAARMDVGRQGLQ